MVEVSKFREIFGHQKTRAAALRTEDIGMRQKRLTRLQFWIEANLHRIQDAVFADFRKPEMEVNLTEIYPVLTEVRHAIKKLPDWSFPKNVKSPATYIAATSQVYYEPRGVCLIISPWNYPFNLAVGPMISAIAAGNTVMLKPSEFTPNTSALLGDMVSELFSADEVAVVCGDADVSRELLRFPFDHIFFTGSTSVGKSVMKAAAENLSSVTLELGGKSPAIIDASASASEAAARLAWGKLVNAGQTCLAPDYIFVHESLYETFIKEFIFQAGKLYGNGKDAYSEAGDYTRIINRKHFDRLTQAIEEAVSKGAKILYGGDSDQEELYLQPTILGNVPEECTLMSEEIFGPVLPVKTFTEIDEAITYVNAKPKPLASYLFGQSDASYQRVLKEISSGALVWNDCVIQFGQPHLPFGGVNTSGIGKAHGKYGFRAFSNEKAVIKQRLPLTRLIYPPYSGMTEKVINYMLKYF